ncbi:DUF2165 family protein [Methylacidiphilum kamchatkense]|uniref:Putative small integral membrane protein n=1 Tax=Methylacidiphilum kamchatkense Kam1 TaxID=1202785 RepID=A0A516TJP0_9BACT|nr:DUF2165 domain-containing protein [Methylacidiphilum kamchatkense]QDQ41436.1 putative small integral membrane protein [Methylacidiphilum kamchatkense Kam1]
MSNQSSYNYSFFQAAIRLSKILILLFFSLYFLLIALNNLLDYETNYTYLRHVLLMDTIPKASHLHSRAWNSPFLFSLVYNSLILWESLCGTVLLIGTFFLFKNLFQSPIAFQKAKSVGIVGLSLGLIQWLYFFILGAGEWFQMWQSSNYNGLPQAFRMSILILVFLLYYVQGEPDA